MTKRRLHNVDRHTIRPSSRWIRTEKRGDTNFVFRPLLPLPPPTRELASLPRLPPSPISLHLEETTATTGLANQLQRPTTNIPRRIAR
jgi:hypothetical protein